MARSRGLCWRSWAALGASVPVPGPSWGLCWQSCAVLRRASELCWWSWGALGACVGGLGLRNVRYMAKLKMCVFLKRERDLRPRGAVMGRSRDLCWRSWAALGAYVGGLGPLSVPMWAVLGCSWGLSWRSGAAVGASVVSLGTLSGLSRRSWSGIRPESGPNPKVKLPKALGGTNRGSNLSVDKISSRNNNKVFLRTTML